LTTAPFLKERGPKNFGIWAAAGSRAADQMLKVSCFFFSKKKGFVSYNRPFLERKWPKELWYLGGGGEQSCRPNAESFLLLLFKEEGFCLLQPSLS
ncbi:MAG: hypothetical protein Q4B50_07840, partial [Bacillota bacterium]|nr:hypothetical protein [Bacillota bacterium]